MARIIWRPVADLPPSRAQDGVAILDGGAAVNLSVRPGRTRHYREVLSLSVDDLIHLVRPCMRDCKGSAERIIHRIETEMSKTDQLQ